MTAQLQGDWVKMLYNVIESEGHKVTHKHLRGNEMISQKYYEILMQVQEPTHINTVARIANLQDVTALVESLHLNVLSDGRYQAAPQETWGDKEARFEHVMENVIADY